MFYHFDVYKVIEKIEVNGLGQELKTYVKNNQSFRADIQPIDAHITSQTWGENITKGLTMYADEGLEVGEIVLNNNKLYRIINMKDWVDYKIYLLDALEAEHEEN